MVLEVNAFELETNTLVLEMSTLKLSIKTLATHTHAQLAISDYQTELILRHLLLTGTHLQKLAVQYSNYHALLLSS